MLNKVFMLVTSYQPYLNVKLITLSTVVCSLRKYIFETVLDSSNLREEPFSEGNHRFCLKRNHFLVSLKNDNF